jgi:hypothetical protein
LFPGNGKLIATSFRSGANSKITIIVRALHQQSNDDLTPEISLILDVLGTPVVSALSGRCRGY